MLISLEAPYVLRSSKKMFISNGHIPKTTDTTTAHIICILILIEEIKFNIY